MMSRRWMRVTLGLAAMVLLARGVEAQGRSDPRRHDTALEGHMAPPFLLTDVHGIPRTPAGWFGMPIVLHFGASW